MDPGYVAQMRPVLLKFFKRKTGSAVEAEDLTQDVLERALAHSGWESPAHAKGYIFRVAINRWHDHRRRQRTRGIAIELDESLADELVAQVSPERKAMADQELTLVLEVLRELDPRTRTVLVLIKFEQMRLAFVAETLGISLRAVSRHLAKALACLARLRHEKGLQP